MNRLVIDADPGVDDAHTMMMAFAHPGAQVEASTTGVVHVGGSASEGYRGGVGRAGHFCLGWELLRPRSHRLGLENKGGMVRIGAVHYNTVGEIERLGEALRAMA